jgi:hypothetical protein
MAYSGKYPGKKKKSAKGSANSCITLFIWGVGPVIHSMFAMVSSARLVAMATIIHEQSWLHWWSVTTCFVPNQCPVTE